MPAIPPNPVGFIERTAQIFAGTAGAALLGLVSVAIAGPLEDAKSALEQGEPSIAFGLLKPLAENGHSQAQTNLGLFYQRGQGVVQNFARAAEWYRKAAEQGDPAAQNRLGALYRAGLGVPQDHAKAVHWLGKAAERGLAKHQFDLAVMYDNGLGVAKDGAQAAHWYGKAAEQGMIEAEASLGLLYYQGAGVERDMGRALVLLRRAAEKGSARAQNNLGLLYSRGHGVGQDYENAVVWFRKAADQGLKSAMANLGVMYDNGFGVTQDGDAANALYRAGGLQGSARAPNAIDAVDYAYDHRLKTPALSPQSVRQYAGAARQGDPIAQFILAYLHSAGPGRAPDFAAAAGWYRKAADKGVVPAMNNLGLLYARGLGVPQDAVLAYMWLSLSAAHGFDEAGTSRDLLTAGMTPGQINEAQALASRKWDEMVVDSEE